MSETTAPHVEASDDAPDLVIRSIADMMEVLRGPDIVLRIALLRQIAQQPEGALRFGRDIHGQDIVDELVHQSYQNASMTYYKALLMALGAYPNDPRAIEVVKKAFLFSKQPQIVDLAAKLISNNAPRTEVVDTMRSVLHQDNSDMHARAAAMVLAAQGYTEGGPAERLRMLLIAPAHTPVHPPLSVADLQHRNLWLAELSGVYAPEAHVRLESLGEPAVVMLAECWPQLSEENRAWLLVWGAQAAPLRILSRLEAILTGTESASAPLQLAAVEAVGILGPAGSLLAPKMSRFLDPEIDPTLRRAAILAGAQGTADIWQALADTDSDHAVRTLAIPRYVAQAGAEALPDLLRWMRAEQPNIRAAAADSLAALPSERVIPEMRALIHHEEIAVRAGAANVLIAHADEDWLEENLLG